MKRNFILVIMVLVLGHYGIAHAISYTYELIDFETGFSDLDPLGPTPVVTGTNSVQFWAGIDSPATPTYIAGVGPPLTAFVPYDTPATDVAGDFFLTDQLAGPPDYAFNYFIIFENPVIDLEFDFFDFRGDGGAGVGSTATLTVFSDSDFSFEVGSDAFTLPTILPDGYVNHLSVLGGSPILSASLVFDPGDLGTGIDNISYKTVAVPEPSTLLLLGTGLVGLVGFRKKFKS